MDIILLYMHICVLIVGIAVVYTHSCISFAHQRATSPDYVCANLQQQVYKSFHEIKGDVGMTR